ncbi:reverse transcriptase domain-containing protein [Tanacetum coccineum]
MTIVNQGMCVEEIEQVLALNYKKVGHITQNCRTPTAARNQRTRTCYECGSLRYYKSECPIVKFSNRVVMIHGRVMASKPKTMQDAIEIATKLMGKKISTSLFKRQAKNKRKLDNNNLAQQQPPKKQCVAIADTARPGENKEYAGTLPLCNKKDYAILKRVHHTFHVSNLKKCYTDEPLAVSLDGLHIDDKLHFIEEPAEIMDREVKQLKQSRIPIVKVRWNSRRGPEFT